MIGLKSKPIQCDEIRSFSDTKGKHLPRIEGNPHARGVSTRYWERQNLSMRVGMQRFIRRANAHSKKIANRCHELALYFVYYTS